MANQRAYMTHEAPDLAAQLLRFDSVSELVDLWATEQPDRIAFSGPSETHLWRRVSWSTLRTESINLAAGLMEYGIRPGDHVGILANGSAYIECFLAYMALLRIGGVMVPLNPRYADTELQSTIDFADCSAIISQPEITSRVESLNKHLPKLVRRICMGSSPLDGWLAWPDHLVSPAATCRLPKISKNHLANILFTSGTTAKPKGVMHTHGSALATGAIFSSALNLKNSDIFHHAIPFFTSSGSQFSLMPVLWVGATLLVEPKFDAKTILQRIDDEKSTALIGVPSHYIFMLEELEQRPRSLPSIRLWDYGGAPMPSQAVRELAQLFPHTEQRQNYGMTETGPSGALLTPEQTLNRINSVGLPMPLCEVQVANESGIQLTHGETGEIHLRSPACMLGYYNNPEATVTTLTDGWVHTGDVGWMDADGYLYYSDRTKDIINRGGLKISSMEVEDVLYKHPGVLEAAVIAMPHKKLGEDMMAFIVAKPDFALEEAELMQFCSQWLADYKTPRNFTFLDTLPKNPMGKIAKTGLRDLTTPGK